MWKLNAENKKFDGNEIDGWTINIIEDVELKEEIEKLNAEIKERLGKTSKEICVNPRTGGKTVNIWVHNLTPEAKKLHNTTLYGWKIYVWKSLNSPKDTALRDPRIKEMVKGKEYEMKEVTKPSEKGVIVDVYIYIKEPKKTIIATVDVINEKVIEINESNSWLPVKK